MTNIDFVIRGIIVQVYREYPHIGQVELLRLVEKRLEQQIKSTEKACKIRESVV